MNDNPIMQRVMMLSEMWKTEVDTYVDASFFSWVGSSLIEFKTIKGFTIYQTSNERNIADSVFLIEQPFTYENINVFNHEVLNILNHSIQASKADEKSAIDTCLDWEYSEVKEINSSFFISKLNDLTDCIHGDQDDLKLVLAIYPKHIANHKLYATWVGSLLDQKISERLKFMLYDGADVMMFKEIAKSSGDKFKYLYPDLDISGAMNDILQQSKSPSRTAEENDTISFQQALIKLTEAIGSFHKKDIDFYEKQCFSYTEKHDWLTMEGLVHFYLHGYYASNNKSKEALKHIDIAISKVDIAYTNGVAGARDMQYHYRLAKGNSFFMQKSYQEAVEAYEDSLKLPMHKNVNPLMIAGIYQMLGNALRKASGKKEAFEALEQGWGWMEKLEEENIKQNTMSMFYAKDMLEVARQEKYYFYKSKFEGWWGRDWEDQLSSKSYQLMNT